jgi:hypothetical protein
MNRDGAHTTPRPRPARFDAPDLHLCRSCEHPFVVPTAVLEVIGRTEYRVELGCTNCGASRVAVESEERLEALDRELDRQTADMCTALELWSTSRQLEEIDAFARALHADLILPEDF